MNEIGNLFIYINPLIVVVGIGINLIYQIAIEQNLTKNRKISIGILYGLICFGPIALIPWTSFISNFSNGLPAVTIFGISLTFLVQSRTSKTSESKCIQKYSVIAFIISVLLFVWGQILLIALAKDNLQELTTTIAMVFIDLVLLGASIYLAKKNLPTIGIYHPGNVSY